MINDALYNAPPDTTIILYLAIMVVFIGVFLLVIIGYKARKKTILEMFGSKFFTFGIINPAGMLTWIHRTTSDFKVFGKVILFYHKNGAYRITEDTLFWIDKVPHALYKFGNPNPYNIMDAADATIKVFDEDLNKEVEVKLSSQELKGAIESKVVNELNKVGFNRIEMITLIVMFAVIILSVINVFEIYSINSELSSLINQLNQILKNLPTGTTPAAVIKAISVATI